MSASVQCKYYAFISYSRVDFKVASFIKTKIEKFSYKGYHIQESLKPIDNHYLRYIFLDKADLGYNNQTYKQEIGHVLRDCMFLIVLCSPYSKVSSEVDWEIKQFIDTHEAYKQRIIAVIVSGNPGKVDDPIPHRLQVAGFSERNLPHLFSPNKGISKKALYYGLIGIISFMTQIDHRKIKRRFIGLTLCENYLNLLMGTLSFFILPVVLIFWYHDHNEVTLLRENENYHRNSNLIEQKEIIRLSTTQVLPISPLME